MSAPCCCCWLGGIGGGLATQFRWCWRRASPRAGRRRGAAHPRHHHAARLRAARAGPRQRPVRHGRGAGAGAGPSIGGVLVDWFGWRSIFFMVVPFCLASIWLAYRYVPTSAPGGADRRAGPASTGAAWLLATVGTLCLLNGLVELRGGDHGRAIALLVLAAVALVRLIAWLRRAAATGREPLMNLACSATAPSPSAASSPSSTASRCSAPPTCCRCTCSWAAAAGLARGHHPAARRHRAGHHHRHRRPAHAPVPTRMMVSGGWCCWRARSR
jgi:hypothetical protein